MVDDLSDASKVTNLSDLQIIDYIDWRDFHRKLSGFGLPKNIRAVFHQGACSDTMATDGREVMESNFTFSKTLLENCLEMGIPLIYASSAAVYGRDGPFAVGIGNEMPLNVYAYSKFLFDQLVRHRLSTHQIQVVGLRYFNVYGPREAHKGRMASIVYQLIQQFERKGSIRLFEGTGGFANGEQRRDFIWVKDVALVNLYMLDHPEVRGIINVGVGQSRSFNDVALSIINSFRADGGEALWTLEDAQVSGAIEYIPFPKELSGKYQSFTEAKLETLRESGYRSKMTKLEAGVSSYIQQLTTESELLYR